MRTLLQPYHGALDRGRPRRRCIGGYGAPESWALRSGGYEAGPCVSIEVIRIIYYSYSRIIQIQHRVFIDSYVRTFLITGEFDYYYSHRCRQLGASDVAIWCLDAANWCIDAWQSSASDATIWCIDAAIWCIDACNLVHPMLQYSVSMHAVYMCIQCMQSGAFDTCNLVHPMLSVQTWFSLHK